MLTPSPMIRQVKPPSDAPASTHPPPWARPAAARWISTGSGDPARLKPGRQHRLP